MSKSRSWGFPRWGGYGSETRPQAQRLCDREGCTAPGDHPAPKARHSNEKWWFCREHAAHYNRAWDYFAGMSYEDMRREEEAAADYAATSAYAYAAPAVSREERRAYAILDLESTATAAEIKSRYRQLAKRYHPDANRGDAAAAEKFHELQRAYEVLTRKPETARRA